MDNTKLAEQIVKLVEASYRKGFNDQKFSKINPVWKISIELPTEAHELRKVLKEGGKHD